MIETLCRGKTKKGGEWVEGVYMPRDIGYITGMKTDKQYIIISSSNKRKDGKWAEIIPETVGQYIGKGDKNGKKIFEGDIVKHCGAVYQVVYDYDLCAFIGINDNGSIWLMGSVEVVGCIHEKG